MINIINRLIESGTFTESGYKYTLDLGFDGMWIVYRTPVINDFCDMRKAEIIGTFRMGESEA